MPSGGRAARPNPDLDSDVGQFDTAWEPPPKPNRAAKDGDDQGGAPGSGRTTARKSMTVEAQKAVEELPQAKRVLAAWESVKLAATGEVGDIQVDPEWPPARQFIGKMISSNIFVCAIGLVICFNIFIVLLEADRRAGCEDSKSPDCPANADVIRVPDRICGVIYVIEIMMRLYVFQSRFCCSFWNVTDTLVVIVSIAGELFQNFIQNAALIRLVRIVRIVRILRVITMFQELYLMIASLASTMRTIFWACIMLVIVISIMSLLAVETLHPTMKLMMEREGEVCERCPKAFSSIRESMVTFFATIIMGDGIFDVFVPLIEEDGTSAIFILTCVALVYLGFSNLVLSVIVDKANEARCQDTTYQALVARKLRDKAQKELLTLWAEVDTDGSNTVTLDELKEMHETSQNFKRYFKSHNIDLELLTYAFSVMDPDGDGHCDFEEFAETLVRLRSTDAGPATAFMKHQMGKMVTEIGEIKELLSREKTTLVETQDKLDDESDKFTVQSQVESKKESKANQSIAASLDDNLRGVADIIANAMPAIETVVSGPTPSVDMEQHTRNFDTKNFDTKNLDTKNLDTKNFDFISATPPAGSGYAGSGSCTPLGAPQPNPAPTNSKWRFLTGAEAKKQMNHQSPSEAAEELVELLKYAYEGTQPLSMQYLRGLEWHYADLCQRVEVQLGRLTAIVQDSGVRARMELFCCSARLISSLGAAMPRILPDPSSAFAQVRLPGGTSDSDGLDHPEHPQSLNVHPRLELVL